MEPVRVLHVLHSMNCGGAETLLMNIYRNIDRDKVQFDFLVNVFDRMFFEDEIVSLGGRIFRMPFLTEKSPANYTRRLYDFFGKHPEIRIVHSHLETTTGLILRQARRAGVPVRIAHSHNSRFTRSGLSALPENLYKAYCRTKIVPNATKLFGCSELANKWLFGKNDGRAQLVMNGVDTSRFTFSPEKRAAVRDELGIDGETRVLGHVGRFNDQKNHLFLIDVFACYHAQNKKSILLLVGEGPLAEQVRQKCEGLGIADSVRFLGLRSDVERILQAFDVFLLPSKFEGLPLVLVEAQSEGLPCIVSQAVSTMSDAGCLLIKFLPIDNAEIWADAIQKENRERIAMHEAVAAEGFDILDTAKMLEKFYLENASDA